MSKILPLLALIALGLLLSDVSATGSTPENDFSEKEVQFVEVPSKNAASRDPTALPKKPVTKAHRTAEKAKAPAKNAAKKGHNSVLPEKDSQDGTYDEAEDRIRDFDKLLSHDEHKALKGQGLVEEPLEDDEEDPAVEQLNEEQDEEADQDEQASADAFDELADAMPEETDEEADTPQAHLSDPHSVEMAQMAKEQEAKEASKHIKSTLDRIKKLGIHSKTSTPTLALAAARKKETAAQLAQVKSAMRELPSAAPTKTSASGLQEKDDSVGMSAGPQPVTPTKSGDSEFYKDTSWKLGAGESFGGNAVKRKAKVETPKAAIMQAAKDDEGADKPHPKPMMDYGFRHYPGKFRRDKSVYADNNPHEIAKSTVIEDKIADIDPKTGRFIAP